MGFKNKNMTDINNQNNHAIEVMKFKREMLNVKNLEYQTLNKYYLIKEKRFVCEYEIQKEENNYLHLKDILEQNREKILKLQSKDRKKDGDNLLLEILPKVNREYNAMEIETSQFQSLVQNFDADFLSNLHNIILCNEAFTEIQDLIDEINFNADGHADLRKIGGVQKGEYNLIVLVQLLMVLDEEHLSKGNLYEILCRFIEKFQNYLINMIEYSNRTVDLLNGKFSDEIARMENVSPNDLKNRINKIRLNYLTKEDFQ